MGPAIIEHSTYIRCALEHLNDHNIYSRLTEFQANAHIEKVKMTITKWMKEFGDELKEGEYKFM
eukprot:9828336-Ditylum_brightwellii.AAC.1